MNNGDQLFIASICVGIIALPILGVIGVFISQLYRKQSSRQQIPMEGMTCTEMLTGDVKIEGNFIRDILIIGFFGLTLLFWLWGAIGAPAKDRLTLWLFTFVWGCITVPVIWQLGRALLNTRYYFKADTRQLTIAKIGAASRSLLFSELAGITMTRWQTELTGRVRGTFYLARLELKTKGGETLTLGTLSSYKGEQELTERVQAIAGLITQLTGVRVSETPDAPPLSNPAATG